MNMSQEEEELKQAIALINTGKKTEGVLILKSIIKTNRNNELAWLWLSYCAEKPEDKIFCFREALRINPNNEQTKKALVVCQFE
jgi:tetratricopeptide (TPR) repeat protein